MKLLKELVLILSILFLPSGAFAQKTEITISFSEQFFDALLDAVFQYAPPPEFSLATVGPDERNERNAAGGVSANGVASPFASPTYAEPKCNESIKLLRDNDGIRTSVRFREGRITAPLAFTGQYNPPLIGCVPFGGWAQAVIDLEFDAAGQRLIARVRAEKVSLSGTGGIGSGLIARMVQGSIDKKINPIEIIQTDKVSFLLPIQNSSGVRMKAIGFRHDLINGQLNVRIAYEFEKA
jgi:hypothetical protein